MKGIKRGNEREHLMPPDMYTYKWYKALSKWKKRQANTVIEEFTIILCSHRQTEKNVYVLRQFGTLKKKKVLQAYVFCSKDKDLIQSHSRLLVTLNSVVYQVAESFLLSIFLFFFYRLLKQYFGLPVKKNR